MWSRPPRCWPRRAASRADEIARQTTENFFRLFAKVPRADAPAAAGMTPDAFTILGCGSSGGVPRPALGWGACDPNNPKNRRRRCSLLVERRSGRRRHPRPDRHRRRTCASSCSTPMSTGSTRVLYTHEHADHTHGIDDLRGLFITAPQARRRLRSTSATSQRHARTASATAS